jgi:hypothetical protein
MAYDSRSGAWYLGSRVSVPGMFRLCAATAGVASVQHQLCAGPEAIEQRRSPHVALLHGWCRKVKTTTSIVIRVGVRVRISDSSG